MQWARIDEADILSSARETQGLANMDQIQYAVLETNGGISVIPKPSTSTPFLTTVLFVIQARDRLLLCRIEGHDEAEDEEMLAGHELWHAIRL